jgi:hypothetical protein
VFPVAEKPEKRGARVEIVADPAKLAEAFSQAARAGEQLQNANVFAGLDKAVVPSLANTIGGAATKSILGDVSAFRDAAKLLRTPIVAPEIADVLAGFNVPEPLPRSVAAALAVGIDKARLDAFTRIVEGNYAGALPQIAKMVQALDFPQPVGTQLAEAMTKIATPQWRPTPVFVGAAAEQAIAVAEVEDVAEIIDPVVAAEIERMPPARRNALALDTATLVAAFLVAAAALTDSGEMDAAAITLGCAVALIRLYWRLVGKLD